MSQIKTLHDNTNLPEVRYSTSRSLGIIARYNDRLAEAERFLNAALAYAGQLGDPTAMLDCYLGLSTLPSRTLASNLVDKILSEAIPLAEANADAKRLAGLLVNLAPYYNHKGQTEKAELALRRAAKVLEAGADYTDLSTSITYSLGLAAFVRGDMDTAESLWHQTLEASNEGGVFPVITEVLVGLGRIALRRGNTEKARAFAARALRLARHATSLTDDRFGLEELLAHLRFEKGKQEKALITLADVAKTSRACDIPLYLTVQVTRVELLVKVGKRAQAQLVADDISMMARKFGAESWTIKAEGILARVT